ncbi:DUF4153 domain-containing protein [uncultured Dysosmobacter sp.]|uniref:DUF4153 domain-containing protein n=1 Tax=uncultured Dysosmobacter sp. TaxID=2591384 RepID=UPI0026038706|nr:DUF4173 domain-containing protein [uncultured Dysosmobacter sp.]
MSAFEKALPAEGLVKSAQNPAKTYEAAPRDRLFLFFTAAFCVLLTDTLIWHGPTAGLTAAVFAWYVLVLCYTGTAPLSLRSNRVLLLFNLFLAAAMALGSNWYFRLWNLMALLVLLPVHALALSGAAQLPWWRPMMLWERFLLLLRGLFCHLGAVPAAAAAGKSRDRRRVLPLAAGAVCALVLLAFLIPILASADALFAAATADLRRFMQAHFSTALWKLIWGLVLTPFLFGLLYSLRHPVPLKARNGEKQPAADALGFAMVLAALDALYLLFLAIQSAGLFGGADYLAQRGISYAEWARSGFFQMVGVTAVNLTAVMAALSFSRQEGRCWTAVRLLAALLALESLVLLASAAWRMTLYVSAYGLSFKRCMTYWGMVMMALFLLAALRKVQRPDRSFCRLAFPLALAGWLVINCVPVDYLVAKDQVDRYLAGESAAIDVEYLLYDLSYDTLSQLERLDGGLACWDRNGGQRRLDTLILNRRISACRECADWHTWSLSACLAAGQSS